MRKTIIITCLLALIFGVLLACIPKHEVPTEQEKQDWLDWLEYLEYEREFYRDRDAGLFNK